MQKKKKIIKKLLQFIVIEKKEYIYIFFFQELITSFKSNNKIYLLNDKLFIIPKNQNLPKITYFLRDFSYFSILLTLLTTFPKKKNLLL